MVRVVMCRETRCQPIAKSHSFICGVSSLLFFFLNINKAIRNSTPVTERRDSFLEEEREIAEKRLASYRPIGL